ncbi:TonB-dependent receptor domain-containing protein [Marinibactrum halimedae]|uniref:TonB-dependent receptor n=1 Tax=Marinibactrum halimedae TaxID=1444977 RepID=A0AA37T8Q0_9GAMM|nr:TonB-dependent receptor [Marinibactrum halimedae]MCD9458614.1 TonB-dependent receptor [Marinibactrum halimedae]GLS26021.1 TonB-dependent receptor [Marinibactrum halimedae]
MKTNLFPPAQTAQKCAATHSAAPNRRWLSIAIAAASTVFCGSEIAMAQEDGQQVMEEVMVTGSRILRNPLNDPAPVMDISETDLERTGLTNIGSMLQQLPMTGSAINAKFNVPGNSGFPADGSGIGAGAVQVSLRNVGAKRTLILVDGKRWVAGASASGVPNAVDLNTIPSNVIKRVEVLQDGASAIYGSDAIGGVINIITHSDFEGVRFSTQTGEYLSEGDGETSEHSFLWGGKSEDTHFVFSANYAEEKAVLTSDRDQSAFPSPFATSCEAGGCSSFTPQGRFILGPELGGANLALNDGVLNDGAGNIPSFDPNNPTAGDFHEFTNADRFNFNGENFNYLQTPNERINLYTEVTHDFSETFSWRTKASYTNRKSNTQGAPEPLCFGNGCGNAIMENIVIDADQIYNPFGVDLSVADGTLDFFGRRPLESGPRIFEQDVDTYFISSGLEGEFEFAERTFYWDATASYGENSGFQQKRGAHNAARIAIALGDPAVCAAVPGCVPFNLFGGQGPDGTGSITEEMLDFIGFTQRDYSEQTLIDYSANITGELASLPAGPLAFASGFEFRKHKGSFQPDPVAASGETAGIPAGATAGSFDVTEYYAELNVPILAGVAGADYLELNLALRNSDYSNFGNESTYKVGALWRPIADVSLRSSVSTGIRAPGIGELFGGNARSDFNFTDPCSGLTADSSEDLINNCAALGVPAGMSQPNPQLSSISFGNEELSPETSDSFTFGIVYSPSWVDNVSWMESLTASVDFYELEIDDAIQAPNPGDTIAACVETLDPFYCNSVERAASGVVNFVNTPLNNIGAVEASGYDIALRYLSPMSDFGQFGLRFNATHLSDYTEKTENPDGSFSKTDFTGLITDETFQRAFPEWRYTSNVDWNYENWTAGITFRYVDQMTQPIVREGQTRGVKLGSEFYTDLQLQYRPTLSSSKEVTITVGANNIFDNDPSVCDDACGSTSMSPVVHDLPGTVAYLRLSVDM